MYLNLIYTQPEPLSVPVLTVWFSRQNAHTAINKQRKCDMNLHNVLHTLADWRKRTCTQSLSRAFLLCLLVQVDSSESVCIWMSAIIINISLSTLVWLMAAAQRGPHQLLSKTILFRTGAPSHPRSEVLMASAAAVHACVDAHMCVLLYEKDTVSFCLEVCLRVAAGESGWGCWGGWHRLHVTRYWKGHYKNSQSQQDKSIHTHTN